MRVSATLQGIIDEECDITQKALPPAAAKIAHSKEQKEERGSGSGSWLCIPTFQHQQRDYWSFHA